MAKSSVCYGNLKTYSESNNKILSNLRKIRPWVADQALGIVLCAHLQATESSAPFDSQHYPSVY